MKEVLYFLNLEKSANEIGSYNNKFIDETA